MKKLHFLLLPLTAVLMSCNLDVPTQKVEYKTLKVKKQDVTIHYNYSCSLKGEQDVDIVPQASGTLMEIKVMPGEHVKKGQTMFIIDQVPSQAELRMAKADVKVAKASAATAKMELESKKDLRKKNIVSDVIVNKAQNEYETAIAAIEQAEARVTNAEQSLSFTVVKAPCDGIVGDIPYRVGALVGPISEKPLTTVSNNKNIIAIIALTESDLLNFYESTENMTADDLVKEMPNVKLRTSIGTMYPEEGRIQNISGVINNTTGTMSIRAKFPNPKGVLRSGGAAEVVVPYEYKNVIIIPQGATVSMQDKMFAYKVVDNKAKSVAVQVVPTDDNQNYIVVDGLKEGDVIIAEGAGNVKEGEEASFEM